MNATVLPSVLDNSSDERSVLDMTTTEDLECQKCGREGTDGFEFYRTTIYVDSGPKRGMVPRCADRQACDRRVKNQAAWAYRDTLTEAADDLKRAREAVKDAEKAMGQEIKRALKEKVSVTDIARWTGISRERVYQIRDGRR